MDGYHTCSAEDRVAELEDKVRDLEREKYYLKDEIRDIQRELKDLKQKVDSIPRVNIEEGRYKL